MIDKKDRMEIATFQKPKKGNYHSGDSYFYVETDDGFLCALADGLGSGEVAKNSADTVIDVIKNSYTKPLDELVHLANEALFGHHLRGCVLGILRVDYREQFYSYVSVGNISVIAVDHHGKKRRNIPVPGYLSGVKKPVKVHYGELQNGSVFFMFSDGVNERKLTKEFYSHQTMDLTIQWFTLQQEQYMDDDTTLIAMKYNE
ncbi:negative regulator of sigma-B (phosphoserine phosphatase) [Alkalibacillus filiformis]|uniref:Negative regulator of sigma-B (Phosphoserine phosphatase) n=1 Tax=Alkalibacillus filiformis TaxID=200990 RepID=A0ABU0DX07_9BACI|nr:SpoIIE family protein phosphatase [Alkalibacillus filiformis]MDQ0352983.1 negative regulator of sigma-B (phosphoserine phosphatase) [Alkalibacillus filiformis]